MANRNGRSKLNTLLNSVELSEKLDWFSSEILFKDMYLNTFHSSLFHYLGDFVVPKTPLCTWQKIGKLSLEKLLFKSRQCSTFSEILNACCYTLKKKILFLVFKAIVFPTHSLIHPSHVYGIPVPHLQALRMQLWTRGKDKDPALLPLTLWKWKRKDQGHLNRKQSTFVWKKLNFFPKTSKIKII